MATRKPWETLNTYNSNSLPVNQSRFPGTMHSPQDQFTSGYGGGIGASNHPSPMSIPPPLPPRPTQSLGYSSYNSYSPYASSYGSPFSSMYSNPYGGNPYGYGGYGLNRFNNDYAYGNNGFLQMAEESSRQAFQPIESSVQAIGSIYMMLDSMYHATHNSFRAVVGVVDQVSRMKMQLSQIVSVVTILRSLRWFFLRLAHKLGLRKRDPLNDESWNAASQEPLSSAFLNEGDIKRNGYNWPVFMFVALVFGMPWLIWKILSSITGMAGESKKWASGVGDHFVCTGLHNFTAESDREVSFNAGQEIRLAPKELQPRVRGWLLASVDGVKTGFIPANYVKILGERRGTAENATALSEVNVQQTDDSDVKN